MTKFYSYHPIYHYYVGSGDCDTDPLDGNIIFPGDSTLIPPPIYVDEEQNEIAIFDIPTQQWFVVEDQRGIWYSICTLDIIDNLDPLNKPKDSTRKKPPIDHIPDLKFDRENDEWIIDIKYNPDDYPSSNIFPELLPSTNLTFEPEYNAELGRWTFTSTDGAYVESETVDQNLFRLQQESSYESIMDRLNNLKINIGELKSILGVDDTTVGNVDETGPTVDGPLN